MTFSISKMETAAFAAAFLLAVSLVLPAGAQNEPHSKSNVKAQSHQTAPNAKLQKPRKPALAIQNQDSVASKTRGPKTRTKKLMDDYNKSEETSSKVQKKIKDTEGTVKDKI